MAWPSDSSTTRKYSMKTGSSSTTKIFAMIGQTKASSMVGPSIKFTLDGQGLRGGFRRLGAFAQAGVDERQQILLGRHLIQKPHSLHGGDIIDQVRECGQH